MKTIWWMCAALAVFPVTGSAGALSLFAGSGTNEVGAARECRLADPFAVGFDSSGNAYICEMTNNRVVKVDASGRLSLFAGTTKKGHTGDGGPARDATLNGPHHLLVMKNGDVLIADTWNRCVRRVEAATGTISAFAGTGENGFGGDGGPAGKAKFSGVYCLAVDADEQNLFIADLENRRVRAIDLKSKVVRTFAGNGKKGVPADGSDAVTSPLFDPRAVTVASNGDVYILERGGHALRVVDAKGKIRTVVGTGKSGPWTPNEKPLEVTLKGPKHLFAERDGSVLIVDSENDVIRRYIPSQNKVVRVAGTGKRGSALNSDPFKTELRHPHGVSVDARGRIYIADSNNSRVLRIQ